MGGAAGAGRGFILAHPQGYQRLLHKDGAGLSAGQRQRLAIARALYREPSILILDEPTSALDPESERALVQALSGLRRRLTLIIIAHRLRTIVDADRIYVLREGQVVEAGTHREPTAEESYQALWQAGDGVQPARASQAAHAVIVNRGAAAALAIEGS